MNNTDGDNCIVICPAPVCNCSAGQTCSFSPRNCNACSVAVCTDPVVQSSGFSSGALAGAVVAVVLVALLAVAAFIWWRRRTAAARRAAPQRPVDLPARPDAVLSRPDPIDGQPPITPMRSVFDETSIRSTNAGSEGPPGNPFADQASFQTVSARTHSPNVITIGLIPPPDGITALSPPPRPLRSPQISLRADSESVDRLAHVNVSDDSLQPPNARFARRDSRHSVITTSSAASALSNASSAFDILTESPTIVTSAKGVRHQVLGVVKAEVVQAPLHPLSRASSRPVIKSPLSKASFGPDDVNPFGDDSSTRFASSASSVKSTSTFGQHTPTQWTFPPTATWAAGERPLSTQSGTGTIIADIGSATRVVLGMTSPGAYSSARMTRGTLASATTSSNKAPSMRSGMTFDDDELADPHRLSSTSSRADSILEAFPFVPPSPIAARPPRSPTFMPPSPRTPRPVPQPQRASAASAASGLSGLGAFPFQLGDDGDSRSAMSPPPTSEPSTATTASGARASLDTIALMRDLEAFPLPFGDPLRDPEPGTPRS